MNTKRTISKNGTSLWRPADRSPGHLEARPCRGQKPDTQIFPVSPRDVGETAEERVGTSLDTPATPGMERFWTYRVLAPFASFFPACSSLSLSGRQPGCQGRGPAGLHVLAFVCLRPECVKETVLRAFVGKQVGGLGGARRDPEEGRLRAGPAPCSCFRLEQRAPGLTRPWPLRKWGTAATRMDVSSEALPPGAPPQQGRLAGHASPRLSGIHVSISLAAQSGVRTGRNWMPCLCAGGVRLLLRPWHVLALLCGLVLVTD